MFKTIHLALPVLSIERSVKFFESLFGARAIIVDSARGRCTLTYDRFEYSLFEMPEFGGWTKYDYGPFHIGHEVGERAEVEALYEKAVRAQMDIVCAPFERDDGDYAFFVRDEQGIVFEFFYGSHKLARNN